MDEPMKNLHLETLSESFPARMSVSEILQDLKKCFNPQDEIIQGSELQQVIIYYAEQTIEPIGWQALWMCDSKTNPSLKLRLNSPSLVEVVNVDYQSLEATVELIDENHQETHSETVLLTELHPLKHQENSAINIDATHNAIQRIRFFYNHLLLPWDPDIQENWFEVHLPVRVGMYCELRSGMLNQETAVRYHYLLSEAYEVEKKLQAMAEKVQFSDDEMEEEVLGSITELNSKLEQIQQDVEIILNPSTRMLLFGSKVTRVKSVVNPEVLLVVQDQNCLALHQTLNQLESEYSPQLNLRCYPSLQTALDDCRVDDVIAISKGIHSLLNINSLRHGGTLLGIGAKEDIVVHLGCNTEVGLTFDDGNVILKNCTFLVNNKQSGMAVKGQVLMENCIMRGASSADGVKNEEEDVGSWKGFYVAANSKLVLKECSVINFDVGLRVRATGRVALTTSDITSCNIGILAEQNTVVQITGSELRQCKEYAIGVEMDSDSFVDTLQGGSELLKMVPETVKINDCRFTDNASNVKLEC